MDTVVIVLICAACAALAAGALLLIKRFSRNNILDGPDMVRRPYTTVSSENIIGCEYRSVGGMRGVRYILTLEKNADGAVTLHAVDEWPHEDMLSNNTYTLDESAFDEVRKLYDKYGVAYVGKVGQNKDEVLDAPDTSVRFWSDSDSIEYSDDRAMPGKSAEVFFALRRTLEALIPDDRE